MTQDHNNQEKVPCRPLAKQRYSPRSQLLCPDIHHHIPTEATLPTGHRPTDASHSVDTKAATVPKRHRAPLILTSIWELLEGFVTPSPVHGAT